MVEAARLLWIATQPLDSATGIRKRVSSCGSTQPIQPPEPPFYRFFHDIKVVATAKRTSRGFPLPSMSSSSSSLKHSSFTVFKHCQVLCTVYFLIFSGLNSHGAHATFHAPDDDASALPVIVSSSELGFHMRNDSILAFLWPCVLSRHLRKFRSSCTSPWRE